MKGLTKCIILAIILVFSIQCVSAMGVTSVTVDPQGAMAPGTPVTASFSVDATSWPVTDDLQLYTDLDKPTWSYSLIVGGVETKQPSETTKSFSVIGFILSYLKTPVPEVSLKVTLEGTAPSVDQTGNKSIFRVTELDSSGRPITSSQVEVTAMIVNPGDVTASIAARNADLQSFRSQIDEKAAMGIDTSEAEAKYSEAQQDIATAQAQPVSQYIQALNSLNAAQNAISDGQKALDKAWAQFEVDAAQIPINNADSVIAWFKSNSSTENDQELPAIITKREVAVSYISAANDAITTGNYDLARSKAQDAFSKGNESYTDALARQYKISQNPLNGLFEALGNFGGSIGIIVVGIVAVVLVVVGVVIYRKRSRWDELG